MRCAAVRLANVIGSPGSVGPLFEEQLLRGEPMTVTHPEAKRYFLTLAEVAALLAQAMDSDAAEGVLIPDPGEPVRIVDLARRMMAAAGRLETIAMVGLRPGDKLDESLMGADERDGGPVTSGLRRVESPAPENLEPRLRDVETAIAARDVAALLRGVVDLVPDYQASSVLREAVLRQSVAEMAQP